MGAQRRQGGREHRHLRHSEGQEAEEGQQRGNGIKAKQQAGAHGQNGMYTCPCAGGNRCAPQDHRKINQEDQAGENRAVMTEQTGKERAGFRNSPSFGKRVRPQGSDRFQEVRGKGFRQDALRD